MASDRASLQNRHMGPGNDSAKSLVPRASSPWGLVSRPVNKVPLNSDVPSHSGRCTCAGNRSGLIARTASKMGGRVWRAATAP